MNKYSLVIAIMVIGSIVWIGLIAFVYIKTLSIEWFQLDQSEAFMYAFAPPVFVWLTTHLLHKWKGYKFLALIIPLVIVFSVFMLF